MDGSRRAGLASYAALVALSAYGGVVGLATGALDLGAKLNHRLPMHSPVLGAVALGAIVGFPSTVLARFASRGDQRLGTTAVFAGIALIGWIAVELAFIREFSALQPFYAGVGATYLAIGRNTQARLRAADVRS